MRGTIARTLFAVYPVVKKGAFGKITRQLTDLEIFLLTRTCAFRNGFRSAEEDRTGLEERQAYRA
jgi:hypothetical protein